MTPARKKEASRDERFTLARKIEREISQMEMDGDERRSTALPPRVGLVFALNGGLVASLLGPLAPSDPKSAAMVASWPSIGVAWLACSVAACAAVFFGLSSLRVRSFRMVTLPNGFEEHILGQLLDTPSVAKADKIVSDIMRPVIEHNRRLIARRFVLLDCSIRMTQAAILGVLALCVYATTA